MSQRELGRSGINRTNLKLNEFKKPEKSDRDFLAQPNLDCSLNCGFRTLGWWAMDWLILCLIGENGGWLAVGWHVGVFSYQTCPISARSTPAQPQLPPSLRCPHRVPQGGFCWWKISRDGAFRGHNVNCTAPVVLNRGSAPGSITVSWKVGES